MLISLLCLLATAPAAEPPAEPRTAHETVKVEMADHWLASLRALNAVIAGDVKGAGNEGKRLAEITRVEGLPADWTAQLSKLRDEAGRLSKAKTLPDAAAAIGDMGQTCATCHTLSGATPTVVTEDLQGEKWNPGVHMSRHYWGAYAMWMGIAGPSEALYKDGAAAVAEQSPLAHVPPTPIPDQKASGLEHQVHGIGRKALAAETQADRAAALSEIIAVCGECHQLYKPAAWEEGQP